MRAEFWHVPMLPPTPLAENAVQAYRKISSFPQQSFKWLVTIISWFNSWVCQLKKQTREHAVYAVFYCEGCFFLFLSSSWNRKENEIPASNCTGALNSFVRFSGEQHQKEWTVRCRHGKSCHSWCGTGNDMRVRKLSTMTAHGSLL